MGYYKLCNCCSGEFNGAPGARRFLEHIKGRSFTFSIFTGRPGESWAEQMTVWERAYLAQERSGALLAKHYVFIPDEDVSELLDVHPDDSTQLVALRDNRRVWLLKSELVRLLFP